MDFNYSVRDIVETAIFVAIAVILDLPGLKIQVGNAGGSISFSMVPLFIICLRLGFFKGFIGCGIVYGLITCLTDGWGIQTYPFDYLLGYGSLAVSGFFKNLVLSEKFTFKSVIFLVISVISGLFLRFSFGCLSSIVLYETDFVGAVIYNASYIPLSGAVSLVILLALLKPLQILNNKFAKKSI